MSRKQKGSDKNGKELLQWHPAFYASIQIEFSEEADYLEFRQEYPLGTRPKLIDVLIIKKEKNRMIQKNIGRIFREHNIMEYKGPGDYLGIDDYYKAYAYAYFYKANAKESDAVKHRELTISLVTESYPQKLIRHLEKERGCEIRYIEKGIYYVIGEVLPIQIIVTRRLSEEENLWLRSLTDRIGGVREAEKLLVDYRKHRKDVKYESVMDIVMRANKNKFGEAKEMCKAFEELFEEEFAEMNRLFDEERKRNEEELKRNEEALKRSEEELKRNEEELKRSEEELKRNVEELERMKQNEKRTNALIYALLNSGRIEDVEKAVSDETYKAALLEEFAI